MGKYGPAFVACSAHLHLSIRFIHLLLWEKEPKTENKKRKYLLYVTIWLGSQTMLDTKTTRIDWGPGRNSYEFLIVWVNLLLIYIGFLLGLIFHPLDGGNIFLRNARLSPNYTVLQPKRQYPSNPNRHMLQGDLGGARASPFLMFGKFSDPFIIVTCNMKCYRCYIDIKISLYPYTDNIIYVLFSIFKSYSRAKKNIPFCVFVTYGQNNSEPKPT
jgi:hypothetical protein